MEQKNSLSIWNIAAIMSAFVFSVGMMAINPAIQKLIEAYPEVRVSTIKMVSTLPSLISSFVMMFVGAIVGRKIKYRTVLILAMLCLLTGGMLPIVWNSSFSCILGARAIFGLGMGFIGCRNALIIASFPEAKRSKYLGLGVFVGNSCGVLLQIIAGWLADIGLKQSFLVYAIALLPLALILFFLKEPEHAQAAASANSAQEKVQIQPKVWLYIAILFVWCTLGYSIMTNMSTYIQMRGFGEAGVSGTILALYTLGGAVAAAFSSKLYPVFKRMFIPLCFFVGALGELLVLIGANIPMIAIGTALAGAGYFCMQPQIFAFTGVVAGRTSTPLCTSIVLAASQIGVFLSSYLCAGLGLAFDNAVVATKYCAIIGFAVIGVLFLIYDIRPAKMIQAEREAKASK